jgi:carbon storage regulator
MLVLTRKKNQSIVIGGKGNPGTGEIEVVILDISGETVRLGVRGPREIAVYRKELYEAIREENIRAARAAGEMPTDLGGLLIADLELPREID